MVKTTNTMSNFLKEAAQRLLPYRTPRQVVRWMKRHNYLIGNPPWKAK